MAHRDVDAGRESLLRALLQADVAFVVIGGAALQTHNQPHRTDDVDVTPEDSQANLARLAIALNRLDCKLVVDPADDSQDVPLPPGFFTAASLARQTIWNLQTEHGKLDITFRPAGFPEGYPRLRQRAARRTVAQTSVAVRVAALEDVEHSKRSADRPKDRDYLTRVGRLHPPDAGTRRGSRTRR